MSIPNIIHQIWIQGYDHIPDKMRQYHENCQRVNNNFRYMLWDDDKIKELLKNNFGEQYLGLYEKFEIFAQKADFARYTILYWYGGIYLDMDIICRKNLESFLKHKFFITTGAFYKINPVKVYQNCIIGSVPRHPLFLYIFKNIFLRKKIKNVIESTGPQLFYDSIEEYRKNSGDNNITIIDRKYLDPCNTWDNDDCPYKCQDCYVAHVNAGSWHSSAFSFFTKYIVKNIKTIIILILFIIIALILFSRVS